jgi:hypothetical protein
MSGKSKAVVPSHPPVREMLDEYIESVTDERLPDGKYHPSSMFGCDRKAIYEVRGTDPTEFTDARAKRRFYIGHRLHESIQRTLESHPGVTVFLPEFEVDVPLYNVFGHGDGLILYEGEWWMLEVKSIKRAGVRMGLPKDMHVSQAMVYWWAVKNHGYKAVSTSELPGVTFDEAAIAYPPLGDKLKGILMVYVEKEDLDIYEYVLESDPEWDQMVEDKIASLDMWKDDPKSLPPRLPLEKGGKKNWLCNYCPFATKCWKEDPALIMPEGMEDY